MAQLVNDHITLVNTMSNEVLDEPGDRARHAFEWLDEVPAYRLEFGPRWGFLPRVVSI